MYTDSYLKLLNATNEVSWFLTQDITNSEANTKVLKVLLEVAKRVDNIEREAGNTAEYEHHMDANMSLDGNMAHWDKKQSLQFEIDMVKQSAERLIEMYDEGVEAEILCEGFSMLGETTVSPVAENSKAHTAEFLISSIERFLKHTGDSMDDNQHKLVRELLAGISLEITEGFHEFNPSELPNIKQYEERLKQLGLDEEFAVSQYLKEPNKEEQELDSLLDSLTKV